MVVSWLSRKLVFPLARLFNFKQDGLENVSKSNNYVFVANHQSAIDPLLITSILVPHANKYLSLLVHKNFYNIPPTSMIMRDWKAIKVEKGKTGEVIDKAVETLKSGHNVLIFPEGEVHGGPGNQPFKAYTGAVQIAIRAKKHMLPIGIIGSYQAWKFPHTFSTNPFSIFYLNFKAPVKIHFGKEISLEPYYGINFDRETEENRVLLRKLTTQVMEKIAELAGQKYLPEQQKLV